MSIRPSTAMPSRATGEMPRRTAPAITQRGIVTRIAPETHSQLRRIVTSTAVLIGSGPTASIRTACGKGARSSRISISTKLATPTYGLGHRRDRSRRGRQRGERGKQRAALPTGAGRYASTLPHGDIAD